MQAVHEVDGDGNKLIKIARKVVSQALDGESAAYKEIGDRLDGRSIQQTEHTGLDGGPIQILAKEQRDAAVRNAIHGSSES